jgi:hypothetical protein
MHRSPVLLALPSHSWGLEGVLRSRTEAVRDHLGPALGVVASFASTLASQRLIQLVERDRALWPYAAYRVGLAAAVLVKLRA